MILSREGQEQAALSTWRALFVAGRYSGSWRKWHDEGGGRSEKVLRLSSLLAPPFSLLPSSWYYSLPMPSTTRLLDAPAMGRVLARMASAMAFACCSIMRVVVELDFKVTGIVPALTVRASFVTRAMAEKLGLPCM